MPTIKKLIMHGFKSFAKRTEIPFVSNFSCFIGENGHGKSNITDAICFVLGVVSAKSLRAEKAANLIFNGGKNGSPMKQAEVSLVFDNSDKLFPFDSKEITLTRILKSTGQSDYRINGEKRTRQQVLELLSHAKITPNGHNIIMQKEVDRFVIMSPVERRELVEDIAGIGVYEEKKAKAMLELDKVQAKLNEADIILTERQKVVNDLKKDRDQALKFKEQEKLLKRSKATRLHLLIKQKTEKKADIENKYSKYNSDMNTMNLMINNLKSEKLDKLKDIELIDREMNEKGDDKQKQINKEIETLKEGLIKLKLRKEQLQTELKKTNDRKKGLLNESKEIGKTVNGLKKKKVELESYRNKILEQKNKVESKLNNFKSKLGLNDSVDLNAKLESIEKQVEELQSRILKLNDEKQDLLRKKDKTKYEIQHMESEEDKFKERLEQNKQNINDLRKAKEEFKGTTKKLSHALNESSVFASQLAESRKRLYEVTEKLNKLNVKSLTIKELTANDSALRKIKSMNLQGVYGTVSELANTESKYSLALEVAAGNKLKSVVVNNDTTAAKCIKLLKESKSGIATFLPLNKLKERIIPDELKKLKAIQGVHGFALDFLSYDSKFRNVYKYVFGPTLIVENIETARRIGIGRARMVTLDGDLVETSGAMIGGFRRSKGIGFQEKEVSHSITKLESDIKKLENEVHYLEQKKSETDDLVINLKESKVKLEVKIENLQNIVGKLGPYDSTMKEELVKNLTDLDLRINKVDVALTELNKEKVKLETERKTVRENLSKLSNLDKSSEFKQYNDELDEIKGKISQLDMDINALSTKIGFHESELDKIKKLMSNSETENKKFGDELEETKSLIVEKDYKLKELMKQQQSFYNEYKSLYKKRDRFKEDITKIDNKLIKLEERIRHTEERFNDFKVRVAEINGELVALQKEFEDYKDLSLRKGLSLEELNAEIRSIESSLRGMGNINMRALEVYEKAYEECQKLLQKCETLKLEKEEVLALMYEIDSKKKDAFLQTLGNLRKTFENKFASLSDKGRVKLTLENEEDPFAAGLKIEIELAKNKYMDIRSLSGGEKSLAALSFIFAILDYEPAPFYVFDEIEAALDKSNSQTIAQLLRHYSQKAQCIIISHNDNMISESDVIYGVTIKNDISRVISLKI